MGKKTNNKIKIKFVCHQTEMCSGFSVSLLFDMQKSSENCDLPAF